MKYLKFAFWCFFCAACAWLLARTTYQAVDWELSKRTPKKLPAGYYYAPANTELSDYAEGFPQRIIKKERRKNETED